MALPLLGLLALLALIAWGIVSVVSSLRAHARHAEAGPLAVPPPGALPSAPYIAATDTRAGTSAPPSPGEAARAGAAPVDIAPGPGRDAARASAVPTAPAAYPAASPYSPANAAALNSQADASWQAGRTSEALDAWEKAVQADPTGAAGQEARRNAVGRYKDMAQAAATAGRMDEARTDWQKITEIDPGSDDAFQAEQSISRTEPSAGPAATPDTLTPGVGEPR